MHTPSALHASLTHLNVDKPVNAIAFGWLDSEQKPLQLLLVGTYSYLFAFDVSSNQDPFFIELDSGVSCPLPSSAATKASKHLTPKASSAYGPLLASPSPPLPSTTAPTRSLPASMTLLSRPSLMRASEAVSPIAFAPLKPGVFGCAFANGTVSFLPSMIRK